MTSTYDAAASFDCDDGYVGYSYDSRNQLTVANYEDTHRSTDEAYAYDDNGNRDTANGDTYATGDYNRMTSDGTFEYEYDDEGNRTQRYDWNDIDTDDEVDVGEREDYTKYTWDYRNRLTKVEHFDDDDPSTTSDHTVQYGYDHANRRIKKTLDADGAGEGDPVDTHFIYDGTQIILALDDDAELTNRYLWGPAVDQILTDEQVHHNGSTDYVTDEVYWPLSDHLGTVRDTVTFAPGTPDVTTEASHVIYDAFGNIQNTPTDIDQFFHFTGRPLDEATGLQNNLNRWYDATTGKWLSEDPIGFRAGDANLSRYVENKPNQAIDPNGQSILSRAARKGFKVLRSELLERGISLSA